MPIPNLKSIRMFDAAARHLNFRRAAEELSLTQGAVAQQVRQLEARLGIKLFKRLARGLALTDSGSDYHREINRALRIIEAATRKVRPGGGQITLSVTPSFASKWLVPRLASFAKLHPDIEIRTVASEGIANFQFDEVDIAIRQGTPPFGKGLHVKLLSRLELCAVCSPEYAEQTATINQFEDFAAHRLIQDGHKLWEKLFKQANVEVPNKIMSFNQTALAMDAAESGQGVTLAPRILLGEQLSQGKLVRLWQDELSSQDGYYIVYPESRGNTAAQDEVTEWLLLEAQQNRS